MKDRLTAVFIVSCAISTALCQWLQYNGSVYYFSDRAQPPDLRNYTDAVDACNEQHGGALLVSINSEEENRFLSNNGFSRYSWIGLMCEAGPCDIDDLLWADGSQVNYYRTSLSQIPAERAVALYANRARWYTSAFRYRRFYICEKYDTCSFSPCLNGGTCLVNSTTGNWSCECPEYTSDDHCTCDDSYCENGRPCVNGENATSCDCGDAFTGSRCELDINECLDANFCNGGRCTNTHGGFACDCPSTRQGDRCENDVNECQVRPTICQNGAKCHNEPHFSYSCDCDDGYIGQNCQIDIDECASTPCINGACVDTVNFYSCVCDNGYTGQHCDFDIDECVSNPCNNGACVDAVNYYTCNCGTGYMGEHCDLDIDECENASEYCSPQSGCLNSHGSYSCVCPIGFEGADCSDDVNECEAHGCHSNGECTNYHGSYTCVCLPGYDVINDCAPQPSSNRQDKNKEVGLSNEASIAMLALGCLLAVAGAIAVFIGVMFARKWKKPTFNNNRRHTYDEPEANPTDTELYEIKDSPTQSKANRGVSQIYEDVTATASVAVAGSCSAHIYQATEPDDPYANTIQEQDTYDKLTF